jgi:hypothetical protein
MKIDAARRLALSLPEVTEAPHFEKASFRIRGKIIATIPQGNQFLHVFVDEHITKAFAAEDPAAFEELFWGKKLVGVRIALRKARTPAVRELLEEAWRLKAPKRLVASFDSRKDAATSTVR